MFRRSLVLLVVSTALLAAVGPVDAHAAPRSASVTATAPDVDIRARGAHEFTKVSKTKDVRIGDLVRTDAAGLAQVDYGEGSYTRLDHHTKFVIKKLTNNAGDRRVKTTLLSGQTFNRVEKITESGSFEQTTGGATVGVRGTTFAVARKANTGTSTFTLVEGTLNLRVPGEKPVRLTSGQRVEVVKGVPGPVESLTPEELCADPWICASQGDFTSDEAPGPTTVPFSVDSSGTLTVAGSRTLVSGSGTSTFGPITFSSDGSIGPIPQCPDRVPNTVETTFTTAGGDQFFLSRTNALCQSSTSPPTYVSDGSITITGGTGRFEGATGGGSNSTTTMLASTSSGTVSSHFEGTITLRPQA